MLIYFLENPNLVDLGVPVEVCKIGFEVLESVGPLSEVLGPKVFLLASIGLFVTLVEIPLLAERVTLSPRVVEFIERDVRIFGAGDFGGIVFDGTVAVLMLFRRSGVDISLPGPVGGLSVVFRGIDAGTLLRVGAFWGIVF